MSVAPARRLLGLLHRWLGLFSAVFLFIAGATGAVISWDHELDGLLNPRFYVATAGSQRSTLDLAATIERDDPKVRVTYLPLAAEQGEALQVWVEPRLDANTRQLHDVDYNQLSIDPVTGAELGRRMWGAVGLSRENLLPFLYKLHYSLQIPIVNDVDAGSVFMGIVAIVWVVDAFVSLWLAFPSWRSWRKSLAFRWKKGGHALTFDVHRSGGVWIWLLLLMLAITAVSMNLRTQVTTPIVSLFSTLTPNPFDTRTPAPADQPIEPGIDRARVVDLAKAEASRRGWQAPAGALLYSPEYGVYGVGFFTPDHEHGDGGLGNPWLYFDAHDGSPAGADIPGTGTAGDIFMQAQFPLHSGRIVGITGRVLISLLGVAVATLSVTGIVIWLRKRRARALVATRGRIDARRLGASAP